MNMSKYTTINNFRTKKIKYKYSEISYITYLFKSCKTIDSSFSHILVSLSALKMVKYSTNGFTHWGHTAVDTHGVQALTNRTVDLQNLEHGSDVPDMPESDVRELATPLRSNATSAAQRHNLVA